jgi:cytochrome c-type biogenesis protein CcmF
VTLTLPVAELGHFALALALAIALVQSVAPLIGAARGHRGLMDLAPAAALLQFACVAIAFAALMHAYVTSDFSVLNVAENSHSAKPLLYKITGVWSNHEGSMLLWAFILTAYGAAVALFGRNLPPGLRARVLAVQGMIGVGFLSFILFTSNPFLRLAEAPPDGRGMNPILQDPGLAIHPPFLYTGYVGFSIAFSFAVAALLEGRVDAAWARWVRPWTLAAWCALTAGICLGSWWAYYELGWGGWWAWDPVENASFMPWLVGTALLHSAIVVEKRGTLKTWTIFLALLTFSLSLLGTFIVRSGVLTSVHAFAVDPRRGAFILGLLVVVIGGSLLLYAVKAPALRPTGSFAVISREAALVMNNILLAVATLAVLLGTPLLQSDFRAADGAAADLHGGRAADELEARRSAGGAGPAARGTRCRGRGGCRDTVPRRRPACTGAARPRPRRLAGGQHARRMGRAREAAARGAGRKLGAGAQSAARGLGHDHGAFRPCRGDRRCRRLDRLEG